MPAAVSRFTTGFATQSLSTNMATDPFESDIVDMDYQVGEVELSYKPTVRSKRKISTASDVYKMLLPTFREDTISYKEYFKVVFLNQAQEVLGYTQISEGGITETSVDVRIILQAALLTNATALILVHNHPSGNLRPSQQDITLTEQVRKAAEIMRIAVLDHVILVDGGYCSFAEEGLL